MAIADLSGDGFSANGLGCMTSAETCGNVLRLVPSDYFATLAASGVAVNPQGPADSFDPEEPGVPSGTEERIVSV